MKIKKIDYRIYPNGKWKSEIIAKDYGKYSYPILLTIIEEENGKKIEIPLSYKQIIDMLEKHIWLEKILDWNYFRKGDKYKRKQEIIEACEKADAFPSEIVIKWFEEAKKK